MSAGLPANLETFRLNLKIKWLKKVKNTERLWKK